MSALVGRTLSWIAFFSVLMAPSCGGPIAVADGDGPVPSEETIAIPHQLVDQEPFAVQTYELVASGRLTLDDGRLFLMDGNALTVSPAFFEEEIIQVDFSSGHVDVTTLRPAELGASWGLLVHAVAPDKISRWGPFQRAYGTSGGLGGALTPQALEADRNRTTEGDFISGTDVDSALTQRHEMYVDSDGEPGFDTMVFANSFGDSWFPMSHGFGPDGELVAIAIWQEPFHDRWDPDY